MKPDAQVIRHAPVPFYKYVQWRYGRGMNYSVPVLKPWQRWRQRKGLAKRVWSPA